MLAHSDSLHPPHTVLMVESPPLQVPRHRVHGQVNVPPQPSEVGPQSDSVHVLGMHPQAFGVPPPPQVLGKVQS
jgi:hypothetical protein